MCFKGIKQVLRTLGIADYKVWASCPTCNVTHDDNSHPHIEPDYEKRIVVLWCEHCWHKTLKVGG